MPGLLVFVKLVMHLPELSLKGGRFSSACRVKRVLMIRHRWVLTEDDSHPTLKLVFHCLEYRMKQGTRRTFEVPKLFNCHCRSCRPLRVRRNGAWRNDC